MLLVDRFADSSIALEMFPRRASLPYLGIVTEKLRRMRAEVEAAPVRLVFENDALEAAIEAMTSRPSAMLDALSALVLPWPRFWMEWDGAHRVRVAERLGLVFETKGSTPQRVGCLVEGDADHPRRFRLRFAWWHDTVPEVAVDMGVPNFPSISPLLVTLDLDNREPHPNASGWRTWEHDPDEHAASKILCSMGWSELPTDEVDAADLLSGVGVFADTIDGVVRVWEDNLHGEPTLVLSLLLLLQARGATVRETVDRTRLNRARVRRKRPPLADHVTVRLRAGLAVPGLRKATGATVGTGAPKRAHIVRAHWVTRRHGTRTGLPVVYLRRAHIRGAGRPIKRTVVVSGGETTAP